MRVALNFIRRVYSNTYLIRNIVNRDLRQRYIGSFLGIFWTIIHPVIQMAIYYFIFSVILGVRLGPEYKGTGFAVWMISGLLPWMLFAEILTRSPSIILAQSNLIKKTVFPSEILPLSNLISALINHVIAMIIFLIALIYSGKVVTLDFLLIFPFMILISLVGMGLSWVFSALNVFLRDIGQLISIGTQIWFFLTPIIYPAHRAPEIFLTLCQFNPMYHAVEGYRQALLGAGHISTFGILYLVGIAFLVLSGGGVIFRKLKPGFADVL